MAEPAGRSRRMAAFGATLSPERVLAKDRNPPDGAGPDEYCERQLWGMKTTSPGQGCAAVVGFESRPCFRRSGHVGFWSVSKSGLDETPDSVSA